MHLMFDLETMGRSSRAAIVQIGACAFDPETGEIYRRMLVNVDLQSSIDAGLEVEGSTVKFWMEQPPAARTFLSDVVCGHVYGKTDIYNALGVFGDFVRASNPCPIWSHATFDVPIIVSAYKAAGSKQPPFRYQDCMDLRTLIQLADYKRPDHDGIPHDALSDCEYQVRYCVEAMKKLKGRS